MTEPWNPQPLAYDQRPARPTSHVVEEQVWAPFLQSALWALACGAAALVVTTILALDLDWPPMAPILLGVLAGLVLLVVGYRQGYRPAESWALALGGALGCLVVAGLLLAMTPLPWVLSGMTSGAVAALVLTIDLRAAFQQRRELLWQREVNLDLDLDGDGVQGRPVEHRRVVVEAEQDGTQHRIELDAAPIAALEHAARCLSNGTANPSVRGLHDTGLTDTQSRNLLNQMDGQGLTRRTGTADNAARELTALGRAVLRGYAKSPTE